MRKSLLILLCLSMSYYIMAQEPVKQKEIGLVYRNTDNFGLSFKTGTDKSLWRFSILSIAGGNYENIGDSYKSSGKHIGLSVQIGKEYYKMLKKNFEMKYGCDLSLGYNHGKFESKSGDRIGISKRTSYTPGFNLVFGFNYLFSETFVVGAEILPFVNYNKTIRTSESFYDNSDNNNGGAEHVFEESSINYGFSSNSLLLTLSYRF